MKRCIPKFCYLFKMWFLQVHFVLRLTHQNKAAAVHSSLAAGGTANEHLDKRTEWTEQSQKPVGVSKISHIYIRLFMVHFTFSAWAEVLNTLWVLEYSQYLQAVGT